MDSIVVSTLFVLFVVGLVIAYYGVSRGDAGFVLDQAGPVSVSDPEDAPKQTPMITVLHASSADSPCRSSLSCSPWWCCRRSTPGRCRQADHPAQPDNRL